MTANKTYDYIITGAGAAGLSLALRMCRDTYFDDKRILLIDRSNKQTDDHTWCFWETVPDIFESVVHHAWPTLQFQSLKSSVTQNITPYTYKMIRSKDLYAFVLQSLAQKKNIEVVFEEILSIQNESDSVVVKTGLTNYSARKVFNSILFSPLKKQKGKHLLLQHFKGQFIRTEKNCFDPATATFMDFTVSQEHGTTFIYVLPTGPKEALIEYTLFTDELLAHEQYDKALEEYKRKRGFGMHAILSEEYGIIPMTNLPFSSNEGNIHHIGTAGGWTKPSTGFTFRFIQKNTARIVEALKDGTFVPVLQQRGRHKFYDDVFLNVLAEKRRSGAEIFEKLFAKNAIPAVLKFLDNETTLQEELKILASLPTLPFMQAAKEELF